MNRSCTMPIRAVPSTAVALSLLIMLLSLAASPASALVDLLSPTDGVSTNNVTIPFEYYVSVPGLTGCSLTIGSGAGTNVFPSIDPQNNSINNITVQGITQGTYNWSIGCTGETPENSVTRTITIDSTSPTVTLVAPANNALVRTFAIDVIPYDDMTEYTSCSVEWNGTVLETFQTQRNTHYTKTYSPAPGNGTLRVACTDAAGNTAAQTRQINYVPEFNLMLTLDKTEYALGEPPRLTINTLPGAAVSVDICPDQPGFVQCTTALIDPSSFPQTVTLPYMNKTGPYIVDGIATFNGISKANQTRYTLRNSMYLQVGVDDEPRFNTTVRLTASVTGGLAPYRFTWSLHNGTTVQSTNAVDVLLSSTGSFIERVTATDAGNNTQQANVTLTVDPLIAITIQALDNATRQPVVGAAVDLKRSSGERDEGKTANNGLAYFSVPAGTYSLLVSMTGYQYAAKEMLVNATAGATTYTVLMDKSAVNTPQVRIIEPANGATATTVKFAVTYAKPVVCALQVSGDGAWYAQNGTMQVADSAVKEFPLVLPAGQYNARVECTDTNGAMGSSPSVSFSIADGQDATVAATASSMSDDEQQLQLAAEQLDTLLQALDGYGPKEKEIISIIGYDKQLRNVKRAVLQAIRDISDLQFRKDLDATASQAERERIVGSIKPVLATTPTNVAVLDTKIFTRYPAADEMPDIAAEIAGLDGMTTDQKALQKLLLPDQQKFTLTTRVAHLQFTYPDGSQKTMSLVQRTITYAKDLPDDYGVIEIIPKEVAQSAKELTLLTEGRVLKDDPVLRFGQEGSVAYLIPKKVDMARLERIQTVLARPYKQEPTMITGYAIWTGQGLEDVPLPFLILLGVILLAYIVYYFDIVRHIRFLIFKEGKQRPVHYVRIMINDARDQLAANNYPKAELLYKEVRLTYDQLPEFAKNELYNDVYELLRAMDAYYFNMIMIELDGHLKAGDLANAISSYEKLTGIYARLDPDKQQELVAVVSGMARRMGVPA